MFIYLKIITVFFKILPVIDVEFVGDADLSVVLPREVLVGVGG